MARIDPDNWRTVPVEDRVLIAATAAKLGKNSASIVRFMQILIDLRALACNDGLPGAIHAFASMTADWSIDA